MRHQRAMPVDLVLAGPHGGKQKPITEQSAAGQFAGGFDQLAPRRPGAVEQPLAIACPKLRVAGHRFAVEAQIVGRGAEQHVRDPILLRRHGQLVVIAMHAGPAVRADVGVAQRSVQPALRRRPGPRLVQPAGLWHANAAWRGVALDRMQQRNLGGQRQFFRQPQVGRRAPKHQAAGKWQQVQLARQIGPPHGRGQAAEGTKREQVFHAAQGAALAPQKRLGPRRQSIVAPQRQGSFIRAGQDAKAGLRQIGQGSERLAIGRMQQAADKIQALFARQLMLGIGIKPAPKGPRRTLFAAAEQRPTHAALVVLRARQRERHQDHIALAGRGAGVAKLVGPIRVVL